VSASEPISKQYYDTFALRSTTNDNDEHNDDDYVVVIEGDNDDNNDNNNKMNIDDNTIEYQDAVQTFWCQNMQTVLEFFQATREKEIAASKLIQRGDPELGKLREGILKKIRSERGAVNIGAAPGGAAFEAAADTCEGDRRVRAIRETYLKGFKVRVRKGDDPGAFQHIIPSDDQLLFLEACLFACLPKIYGDSDWATHHVRVLYQWQKKEIDYFLMIITARRMGKTMGVSMFCAALLLHVPGLTIAVYSTGRRASKLLKELVEKLVRMSGDENALRIINSNQEELFISANKLNENDAGRRTKAAQDLKISPTTSKLYSYPSNVRGKNNLFLIENELIDLIDLID
jgi:hypothetical protein